MTQIVVYWFAVVGAIMVCFLAVDLARKGKRKRALAARNDRYKRIASLEMKTGMGVVVAREWLETQQPKKKGVHRKLCVLCGKPFDSYTLLLLHNSTIEFPDVVCGECRNP